MRVDSRSGSSPVGCRRPGVWSSPDETDDDELELDLDFDDVKIDEARLPALDIDAFDEPGRDQTYDDLLDRRWLDGTVDDDEDEDQSALDGLGVTIELNDSGVEDDAEVVDLDIGALLTPLPADDAELDASRARGHERDDGGFASAALEDMLLPDDDEQHDDAEVGDDDRFPAFEDGTPVYRPLLEDELGPEGEPS